MSQKVNLIQYEDSKKYKGTPHLITKIIANAAGEKSTFEKLVNGVMKTVEVLDISGLKEDGWLKTVPFGAIAAWAVAKIVELPPEIVLNRLLYLSVSMSFYKGILDLGWQNQLKIEKQEREEFFDTLKKRFKEDRPDLADFDVKSSFEFWKNKLVQAYAEQFKGVLEKTFLTDESLSREKREMIMHEIRGNCYKSYTKLFEQGGLIYKPLKEALESKYHEESAESKRLYNYNLEIRGRYLAALKKSPKALSLANTYTPTQFKVHQDNLKESQKITQQDQVPVFTTPLASKQKLPKFLEDFFKNSGEFDVSERERLSYSDKSEDIKKNEQFFLTAYTTNVVLVYGHLGQGKSALCKKIVHDLPDTNYIFFIDLHHIELDTVKDKPLEGISNYLKKKHKIKVTPDELGESILILDGLDQIKITKNSTEKDFKDFIESIISISKEYETIKVLITCCHDYIDLSEVRLNQILILQLGAFTKEEQKEWLKRYLESKNLLHRTKFPDLEDSSLLDLLNSYTKDKGHIVVLESFDHIVESINDLKQLDEIRKKLIKASDWAKENKINIILAYDLESKGKKCIELNKVVDIFHSLAKKSGLSNWAKDKLKANLLEAAFDDDASVYYGLVSKNSPYTEELMQQPVFLRMITDKKDDKDFSKNLRSLYEQAIKKVINHETWGSEEPNIIRPLKAEEFKKYLEVSAFEIYKTGKDYIIKDILKESDLSILKSDYKSSFTELSALQLTFYFDTVRLIDDGRAEAITFVHQNFYHYLTASHIWNKLRDKLKTSSASKKKTDEDKAYDFLGLLVECFPHSQISSDIIMPLKTIMINASREDQSICEEQLKKYLPYLLRKQFLPESVLNNRDFPIYSAVNYFYVFSFLLSALSEEKIKLDEDKNRKRQKKFVEMIRVLSSTEKSYPLFLRNLSLKEAKLEGVQLPSSSFEQVHFENCYFKNAILNNTSFNKSNLTGSDFSYSNLQGANLRDTDLTEANLTNTDLTGADLTNVHLDSANLNAAVITTRQLESVGSIAGATLSNLKLQRINLASRNLSGVDFTDADLTEANLKNAVLDNAKLTNTGITIKQLIKVESFKKAKLSKLNLQRFEFVDRDLSYIDFTGSDLTDANLKGAILSDATFDDTKISTEQLQQAKSLVNAKLLNLDLKEIDFIGKDLTGVDFTGSDLTGANLDRAILNSEQLQAVKSLKKATLSNLNLEEIDLSKYHLFGVDFTGSNLSNARLREASLKNAVFQDADLTDADLGSTIITSRTLRGVKSLEGTILSRLNLRNIDLSNFNLSYTDFTGSDLTDAKLDEADLANAIFDRTEIHPEQIQAAKSLLGATLSGLNLKGIDLSERNLSEVDFTDSDLTDTNLKDADLQDVILCNADITGATFTKEQLQSVRTLWQCDGVNPEMEKELRSGGYDHLFEEYNVE